MAEISETLWNAGVTASDYGTERAAYNAAVFEQYKLCVELADRVSARRNLANTFFVTLHSALLAFLGVWLSQPHHARPAVVLAGGLLVLLALCAAWWFTLRSYQQLNNGKFQVIAALEERLPARAFKAAEWQALQEGRNWNVYLPLTHVERWIPAIFATAYTLGCVVLAV
ncbi:hypothetical protein ABZX93_09995 [Streptomyces sp. NPDC006632]|uniref:RipA family octameric membrane protein n=1 Tax=unclassified Streptomyces TaxID=2593676 RepID=UPI002E24168A